MTQPIKLSVVGVKWPPETFIKRKLQGLADAGFEITVFSPDGARAMPRRIRVIRTPVLRKSAPRAWLQFVRLFLAQMLTAPARALHCWSAAHQASSSSLAALQRFSTVLPVLSIEADIVHFEWNSVAISFLPFWDLLEAKTVISCRGSQVQISPHHPERSHLAGGLATSFERASAVHCVSLAIQREAGKYGLDPAKSRVIRPAVDPEFFRPVEERSPNDGPLLVITTGSLIWRKGYEYALLAIRRLVNRGIDVRFDIIGDGPERQRVLYTVDDLRLTNHVRLLGQLAPADVRSRLQQADVFLLSSLSEGISNAVLEAMACGLPVVTTDCGGMREAVTDGVEGFVVPVRNPEAMADALAALAKDATLRQQMGRAGRGRVEQEFALAEQIGLFTQLYLGTANSFSDI